MKSDIARHGTVRPSVHPITRAQWMMMARMQTFPQKRLHHLLSVLSTVPGLLGTHPSNASKTLFTRT